MAGSSRDNFRGDSLAVGLEEGYSALAPRAVTVDVGGVRRAGLGLETGEEGNINRQGPEPPGLGI